MSNGSTMIRLPSNGMDSPIPGMSSHPCANIIPDTGSWSAGSVFGISGFSFEVTPSGFLCEDLDLVFVWFGLFFEMGFLRARLGAGTWLVGVSSSCCSS